MEDGLSIQTKLCLIKNEREERSLESRLNKITFAKSLWVSRTDHDRNLFLRDHSRLITRARILSGHNNTRRNETFGQPCDSSRQVRSRRKIKRQFLPLISKVPVQSDDIQSQRSVSTSNVLQSDNNVTEIGDKSVDAQVPEMDSNDSTHSVDNVNVNEVQNVNAENVAVRNSETDTDNVVAEKQLNIEVNNIDCDEDSDVNRNVSDEHDNQEHEIGCDSELDVEHNTVQDCEPDAESDSDGDGSNSSSSSSETRKLRKSPSFITELGLIEEEDGETVSPEQESSRPAVPMLLRTSFTPTRRRTQITPTLSPIKDEAEELDEKKEQPEVEKQTQLQTQEPCAEAQLEPEVAVSVVENEEDLADKYIEQVRISNTVSDSDDDEESNSEQTFTPSTVDEREPDEKPNTDSVVTSTIQKTSLSTGIPRSTKRPVKTVSKTTGQAMGVLQKRKSVGAYAVLFSPPSATSAEQKLKIQPLCKRYHQAVIPPEFNLDFITKIIRKNAAKNKSKEDDGDHDDDESGEFSFGKKKKVKRRLVISPAKPRVIWTDAKLSSLPDCRYLRLPPLVQMGSMM